ncbi:FAD/NAD(P)-binding protein [Leptospira levettii]|uniref:FAD/NAD(P)-binding protein n=1 Tax=Leptospira levettii TaxID=2023178 RepID=UPI001EEB78C0|nr:FAD/NAD(P)-binding protein [Leptospira levettii]MCG6149259.1 FAD/NAD(P)-binding protein [Leptospira levettii]
MEKNNHISVAIVGAGLSGSLLAINLLKKTFDGKIDIFLIESSKKRFGRGVAYSPNSIYQKLNVPAKGMSLFPENPNHFVDWWKSNEKNYFYLGESYDENSFFPRFIFGDYLESTLNSNIQTKSSNKEFFTINDEVVDASKIESQWKIKLSSGAELIVDNLILATGNIPPGNPNYLSNEVLDNKRYLHNPWDDSLFESIQLNETLGILGSGLSMVDVIMTLKRKNFQGKIVSFSRSGKLPKVHSIPDHLNPTPFPELFGNVNDDVNKIRNWLRENDGLSDVNLMNVIRPYTSVIWKSWDSKSQRRFIRHVRPYWESFRHRIPSESMAIISEWIQLGKLTFLKARIQSSRLEKETIEITTLEPHSKFGSYRFDRLINCTGPDTKLKEVKSDLYTNLMKKGYIIQSENGIGFVTGNLGQVKSKEGKFLENLYCLGPLRKNELWESTALREIRDQVNELTSVISNSNSNSNTKKSDPLNQSSV